MAAVSRTRVCIKNLPPTAAEKDLKEFLKKTSKIALEITDCKLLKNSKGKSRKVAFLGFRQEDQATYVVDNFNKCFMRMNRLSVEHAVAKQNDRDHEDPTASASSGSLEKGKALESGKPKEHSKHKEELLQLMGGTKKAKFWANDDDGAVEGIGEENAAAHDVTISNMDVDSSDESSSSSEDSDDEVEPSDMRQTPSASALTDMDFLRSKQKQSLDLEEDPTGDSGSSTDSAHPSADDMDDEKKNREDQESDDSSESESSESKSVEPREGRSPKAEYTNDSSDEETEKRKQQEIQQSRLFVRNLPFETTEEELAEHFGSFGKLVDCHIPVDDRKHNKGFAFVQFVSAVDALEAKSQLDKVDFQGRLLHILPARPAPTARSANNPNLTWKQRQELARKEEETKDGNASKGWSASFIRGDAVVDNLADRLGLRKGDLLGVKDKLSSGDAAVRLALGETQIIEENREYFRKHGVDMDALVSADSNDKTTKRSKTAILVKNLPYDTTTEELTKLFQLGEEVVTIMLPPSRTIALVEYGHSSDAKKAFRKLAYRRFKHVPIYLEWAPTTAKSVGAVEAGSAQAIATAVDKHPSKNEHEDETETGANASHTIFVKNLNFTTSEDTLRQVFSTHVGTVRSVRVPKKAAPVKHGEEPQFKSMGYGFVELDSEDLIEKALKKLQGKLVEGHAWDLTVSTGRRGESSTKNKTSTTQKNPTKLVVRNVPFQATRKELLKLFGSMGQLRRVRLPKKFDGTHRGFAFVEFVTSKEALAAMNALSRTHLYGRHLVLEWATDDDQDVDRLRQKAKLDAGALSEPKNKKIRFE